MACISLISPRLSSKRHFAGILTNHEPSPDVADLHALPAPGIMAMAADGTQSLAAGKGERFSENIKPIHLL